MEQRSYDRDAEDLGNIIELGHVNVNIPDQSLSTTFYVTALGLTRDPFLMTGTNNMWVNVGRSQFHLPTGEPNVLRGATGLVAPNHEALLARLEEARTALAGTRFDFHMASGGVIEATCPWGNRIDIHAPDPVRFGPVILGMAYVTFPTEAGTAERIARFYREVFGATTAIKGSRAEISVGYHQTFIFDESATPTRPYDGHHVQIYVANFSGPYRKLRELGIISQESSQHQYRLENIIDLDSRAVIYKLDHEVRSMSHPLYGRPLVNRDPTVHLRAYKPGREALAWAMA